MVQAPELFSWSRLAKGGTSEHDHARAEALELARALAAQTIVLEHDAVIEELPDRIRAIAETIWPQAPLQGYQLHSSLGAWAVAKVAWGWAPSGHIGLRHEPLDREGLLEDLLEHGVDRERANAVVGDWQRIEQGFVPDPMGLEVSRVAGLAECSLTRDERRRALSQVAYSARCLSRLASTINVLSVLRAVLPVLAPESFGHKVLTGLFAIALHRPDRALELIGDRHETLAVHTLSELALSLVSLSRGQKPLLGNEGMMLVPEASDQAQPPPVPQDSDDGDDVLEIVEERVDHRLKAAPSATAFSGGNTTPRPPRWTAPGIAPEGIGDTELETWAAKAKTTRSTLGKRATLLGLRLPPPAATVLPIALPPDERLVQLANEPQSDQRDVTERVPAFVLMALEAFPRSGSPLDAVLPPVRGALRAILKALDGQGPSEEAIKNAGDLRWVLLRARALARIVEGDLEAAVSALSGLPQGAAPESTWAQDRLRRYRRSVRARPEEARELASGLINDLGHQLGRTIAGTVPLEHKAERMR
jgi:hypothetical protein